MNHKIHFFLFGILFICISFAYMGCKKDETTTGPNTNVATYPVTATVLGPSGALQGGATLTLQNPPFDDPKFSTITDSAGKGTIQSPAGPQTIIAKMGTVFQVTMNVTVAASNTPTVVTTPMRLVQNTLLGKTLVIYASAESIEDVLADTSIGYTTFDHIDVDTMRVRVERDSVALLTYLKQYAIVFSNCNGGDEYSYPKLARLYGRYVQQGGNVYGGHYNYYNLQYIFPPYYKTSTYAYGDSIKILNTNLQIALGYNVVQWPTNAPNDLQYYDYFSDLPTGSTTTIYGVMTSSPGSSSSPQGIPIIVENRLGSGKYIWTAYHNQDILADPRLIRIVRYFLYNM